MNRLINTTSLLWLLRQLLQFGGLWLVANGYADQAQMTELIIPAVLTLAGFAGNVYASFRNKATVGGNAVGLGALPPSTVEKVETSVKAAIQSRPNLVDFIKGLAPK